MAVIDPRFSVRRERLAEIHRTFSLFDQDRDGRITASELGLVLRALGQPASAAELAAMVSTVDIDGSGTIELTEFMALFLPTDPSFLGAADDEDLGAAFQDFDRNGDGQISLSELRRALAALGEEVDSAGLAEMLERADADKSGAISYDEFVRVMSIGWSRRG